MLPIFYSIDDVKRVYEGTSQGHWFDKDTMRFFRTKLTPNFRKLSGERYLFITTEQGPDRARMATLRLLIVVPSKEKHCGYSMTIRTMGEFNSMTIYKAKQAMKEFSS